ncbi:hypothetical protein LUZ60_006420 [Juncus effusus]|nr:hypothetical protein LUZ60_006420 [Juncus effusus]
MADIEKWQKFSQEEETRDDDEEALSLSDFPLKPNSPSTKSNLKSNNPTDDFEFRISFSGLESDLQTDMCAAEDVFFNGTILPLRPSVSSRTDSLDLSSTVMSTSRSGSSNSSGTSSHCVSRSQSTKSSSVPDPPRSSISSNFFYTFPSPSPQIRTSGRRSNANSSRKSFSSVPTGSILRLGVIPAPEIDIRSRRMSEKKPLKVGEKKQVGFGGFGCKCGPDQVVEPVGTMISRSKMEGGKKKKIKGDEDEEKKVGKKGLSLKLKRAESLCRTRIFDWLDELNIGKSS